MLYNKLAIYYIFTFDCMKYPLYKLLKIIPWEKNILLVMADAIFWLQWCYLAKKKPMIYKRPLLPDVYDVLEWAQCLFVTLFLGWHIKSCNHIITRKELRKKCTDKQIVICVKILYVVIIINILGMFLIDELPRVYPDPPYESLRHYCTRVCREWGGKTRSTTFWPSVKVRGETWKTSYTQ